MRKVLAILCVVLISSCYSKNKQDLYPADTCDTTNVTYSGTIQPIVAQYCALTGCHNSVSAQNGFDYTTYNGVYTAATSGLMLNVITYADGYPQMPLNGEKLSDCNINKIRRWINLGCPNN
ncbi:MAG TPA: hypothetical protein VN721_02265 [Flavipsychrobacter sp.]|nr:hypothetical protein [Flavipsychrobacter sp.]